LAQTEQAAPANKLSNCGIERAGKSEPAMRADGKENGSRPKPKRRAGEAPGGSREALKSMEEPVLSECVASPENVSRPLESEPEHWVAVPDGGFVQVATQA